MKKLMAAAAGATILAASSPAGAQNSVTPSVVEGITIGDAVENCASTGGETLGPTQSLDPALSAVLCSSGKEVRLIRRRVQGVGIGGALEACDALGGKIAGGTYVNKGNHIVEASCYSARFEQSATSRQATPPALPPQQPRPKQPQVQLDVYGSQRNPRVRGQVEIENCRIKGNGNRNNQYGQLSCDLNGTNIDLGF